MFDLYPYYQKRETFKSKMLAFAKERGIEITIGVVGIVVAMVTVAVGYRIGIRQEVLQATRTTDSYFNGIGDLISRSIEENESINQLIIARTEAIIQDLDALHKPKKLAAIINYIANTKASLFYKQIGPNQQIKRNRYIYLGHLNLQGTKLRNLNLKHVRLPYANLSQTDLTHSQLHYAKLDHIDLRDALLKDTDFSHANLQQANLMHAHLAETNFTAANLEGAIWTNGVPCLPGSIGYCKQH